jgi:uncharacterized membrane protein AbrB (regulator of aidB expression)
MESNSFENASSLFAIKPLYLFTDSDLTLSPIISSFLLYLLEHHFSRTDIFEAVVNQIAGLMDQTPSMSQSFMTIVYSHIQ